MPKKRYAASNETKCIKLKTPKTMNKVANEQGVAARETLQVEHIRGTRSDKLMHGSGSEIELKAPKPQCNDSEVEIQAHKPKFPGDATTANLHVKTAPTVAKAGYTIAKAGYELKVSPNAGKPEALNVDNREGCDKIACGVNTPITGCPRQPTFELSPTKDIEDALDDSVPSLCNGLDLMEGGEDAFPDGGLDSCNAFSKHGTKMGVRPDVRWAANDVYRDHHSISEPEATGIGEQMAPGTGNYNNYNNGNSNCTVHNELEVVEHKKMC